MRELCVISYLNGGTERLALTSFCGASVESELCSSGPECDRAMVEPGVRAFADEGRCISVWKRVWRRETCHPTPLVGNCAQEDDLERSAGMENFYHHFIWKSLLVGCVSAQATSTLCWNPGLQKVAERRRNWSNRCQEKEQIIIGRWWQKAKFAIYTLFINIWPPTLPPPMCLHRLGNVAIGNPERHVRKASHCGSKLQ